MSLKDKVAAVARAEAECRSVRDDADKSLARLKSEFRRGATPVRIVLSGLALGFASGLATSGGAASAGGKLLTGPLLSLLLDTVVPGVLAGITAAATASTEIEEKADASVEEAINQAAEPSPGEIEEQAAAAKPRRKGARRGRAQA